MKENCCPRNIKNTHDKHTMQKFNTKSQNRSVIHPQREESFSDYDSNQTLNSVSSKPC